MNLFSKLFFDHFSFLTFKIRILDLIHNQRERKYYFPAKNPGKRVSHLDLRFDPIELASSKERSIISSGQRLSKLVAKP